MSEILESISLALIEEHVRRVLSVMGFEEAIVQCRRRPADEAQLALLIVEIEAGPVGKMLIGAQGMHLDALQHLVRTLLRRQLTHELHVMVDVNGYRARRELSLQHLAESAARRAQHTGRTVVLHPMAAADRRILHTALASRSDITTESMGDEPNRRVVIRPIFL